MDKQSIAELFMRGQDCGQVVLTHYANELGLSEEEANRMSACYGGGNGIGETCGSVLAAFNVIGMKYGHNGPDDMEQRNELMAKRAEFAEKWKKKRGSCMCRELLGYDLTDMEQLQIVIEKGLMLDLCPELVLDAIDIIDEMIY